MSSIRLRLGCALLIAALALTVYGVVSNKTSVTSAYVPELTDKAEKDEISSPNKFPSDDTTVNGSCSNVLIDGSLVRTEVVCEMKKLRETAEIEHQADVERRLQAERLAAQIAASAQQQAGLQLGAAEERSKEELEHKLVEISRQHRIEAERRAAAEKEHKAKIPLAKVVEDKPKVDKRIPPVKTAAASLEEPEAATAKERKSIEQQIKSINAQYKVPEQLMYKRSAQVVFVLEIEGKGTANKVLALVPGQQAEAQVAVSRFVRAQLSGAPDMVKITLRGGEAAERQFAQFKNVEWVWDIEGLQVGQVDLNLRLLAEVTIGGKSEPIQIETFKKTIPIQISLLDSVRVWVGEIMSLWPFLTAVGSAVMAVFVFFGVKRPKDGKISA